MPSFLRETLDVGRVRGRGDGVFYYEVTRPDHLEERIFPFFLRFQLRGPKANDLEIFREITKLVRLGRHKTPEGIEGDPHPEEPDEPRWQKTAMR